MPAWKMSKLALDWIWLNIFPKLKSLCVHLKDYTPERRPCWFHIASQSYFGQLSVPEVSVCMGTLENYVWHMIESKWSARGLTVNCDLVIKLAFVLRRLLHPQPRPVPTILLGLKHHFNQMLNMSAPQYWWNGSFVTIGYVEMVPVKREVWMPVHMIEDWAWVRQELGLALAKFMPLVGSSGFSKYPDYCGLE